MAGFGLVEPLPGILPWHLDTAITLPVGVEAYGAFALGAWLSSRTPARAKSFARWSALGALALGMCGQVAFHLLAAHHVTRAPWPVVVMVSCVPVTVLGFAAALTHLLRADSVPRVVTVPWWRRLWRRFVGCVEVSVLMVRKTRPAVVSEPDSTLTVAQQAAEAGVSERTMYRRLATANGNGKAH